VPRRNLLLDARVAINLAAVTGIDRIADSLQLKFIIAAQAATEAGYLRDIVKGTVVLTPINLEEYLSSGAVEIRELDATELALYLELASVVDDGEAATIALAIQCGIDLATDDRRARRVCEDRRLAEPTRTVALLRSYAQAARLADDEVREMLVRVRERASFLPARSDPDLKWWNEHIGDA